MKESLDETSKMAETGERGPETSKSRLQDPRENILEIS